MRCLTSSSPRLSRFAVYIVWLRSHQPERYAQIGSVAESVPRVEEELTPAIDERMTIERSQRPPRRGAIRLGLDRRATRTGAGVSGRDLVTKDDLGFEPTSDDPYGPELVSGFLLLSLLVHFHKKHGVSPAEGLYALNYGTDRVRFLTPVMAGQRVRCRARLRSLETRGDGSWRVATENTLELEGSQRPAMGADWITFHAPVRPPGALA